jgi:hypothetical protein
VESCGSVDYSLFLCCLDGCGQELDLALRMLPRKGWRIVFVCFCYFIFHPLGASFNAHLDFRLINVVLLVITNVSSFHDSRILLRVSHDLVGQETIAYVRIQRCSSTNPRPKNTLYISTHQ